MKNQKAYKEFIKKQDSELCSEYRNIKEQHKQNKLNVKEYHKTTEYKEFNKKTNNAINSKIKKQLYQCPDLYKKEINIRLKTFIGDKIPIPKDFTYNDYTKIIKILKT